MSNNDQYEYPEGSSQNKKYGMLSKEGRTESIVPPFLRNPKNIALLLFASGLVYLVTHILSYTLSNRSDNKSEETKLLIKKSDKKISDITSQIARDSSTTKEKLSNFSSKVNSLSEVTRNVDAKLETHSRKMQGLEQGVEDNKQTLELVMQKLDKMNRAMELMAKPKKKKVIVSKPKPKLIKLKNYNLIAMVHGRAWVSGLEGGYKTVKVGDFLQTYGRVIYMNDSLGVIKTSSGRDITYASE